MKPALRTALIALCVAGATLTAVAPAASAKTVAAKAHLYNTRYCEILVAKGALPAVIVTVWNTIGLSTCPPKQWEAFDAPTMAKDLGAVAVVLNGPRFWMMDVASDTHKGTVATFGKMKLRKVASIRITTAADLVQTPYRPRTIDRTNTWTWGPRRVVHELLAPDGAVYLMQAYSQIVDPALRLKDLNGLGARLKLPEGWRYRTRTLSKKGFSLKANGTATIIQDELQNTYQRIR